MEKTRLKRFNFNVVNNTQLRAQYIYLCIHGKNDIFDPKENDKRQTFQINCIDNRHKIIALNYPREWTSIILIVEKYVCNMFVITQ